MSYSVDFDLDWQGYLIVEDGGIEISALYRWDEEAIFLKAIRNGRTEEGFTLVPDKHNWYAAPKTMDDLLDEANNAIEGGDDEAIDGDECD